MQCGFVQSFGSSERGEVVRCGRLRWFGHVEHKSGDDWVSACSIDVRIRILRILTLAEHSKKWNEF